MTLHDVQATLEAVAAQNAMQGVVLGPNILEDRLPLVAVIAALDTLGDR